MAKGKSKSPVVINKDKFLLPKMEWFELDEATGEGLFFKELGGEALLQFKEEIDELKKHAGVDTELQPYQAVDLMAKFIVLSACDEKGHSIFTMDDLPMLKEKNPNLLVDMANKAMPLSGMSPTSLSEVAVDLKNDQPNSSTTASHTNSVEQ